jgi:hypothetical protein
MSFAALRVSAMLGIFGCGFSRKKASFSALKPAVFAVVANSSGRGQPDDRTHTPALRQLLAVVGIGGKGRSDGHCSKCGPATRGFQYHAPALLR